MVKKLKLCILVGTRPEIIKMAPLIKECENREIDFILIHSNQHYSNDLDRVFFENFKLPNPDYNLNVGSGSQADQTSKIMVGVEKIIKEERVDVIFVQGDTNTVLAGAIAAKKVGVKVAHIEAGLRSYDESMPEEINRVLVDRISDYLFAVTDTQKNILSNEGLNNIHVVGNTVSDSLRLIQENSNVLENHKVGFKNNEYYLLTSHRPSNVDNGQRLKLLIECIKLIPEEIRVLWPVHPRTYSNLKRFNIKTPNNLIIVDPLNYFEFVNLMINSNLIITDSGGIQEEACILNIPTITIRDNTERPETITVGSNILTGLDLDKFDEALKYWKQNQNKKWDHPFGDGFSANMILKIVLNGFVNESK